MVKVNVAKDFSRYPAGRLKANGNTSGEAFREKFLIPHLSKGEKIVIELDGAIGYGSSFLEEAFGGAVRATKLGAQKVLDLLEFVTADKALAEEIREYIVSAEQVQAQKG